MDFSVSDHCSFPAFLLRLLRCWLSSLRLCVTASPIPDHRLLALVRTTHLTLAAAKVVSRCDPSTNCQGHSLGRSNLTLWANGTCLSYHTKQPVLPHSLFLHISSLTSCLSLSLCLSSRSLPLYVSVCAICLLVWRQVIDVGIFLNYPLLHSSSQDFPLKLALPDLSMPAGGQIQGILLSQSAPSTGIAGMATSGFYAEARPLT